MLVRRIFIISIVCFVSVFQVNAISESQIDFKSVEDSINHYFNLLVEETNDIKKEELNDQILGLFRRVLNQNESLDYNFSSLKYVGIINSADGNFRIITWNLPYYDRTHRYFGFIQYKVSKRKLVTTELIDKSDEIDTPDFAILTNLNWYGCLYYKIIENKYKGNYYYTLLGADLNDLFTKKKIVEIVTFDRKGNPTFGKKVFKNRTQAVSRVIFEYSAQVNMALTYDHEKGMIVYDHLSPSKPSLKGQFEFYGPDFSYDGLKFERGIWNTYPDIDVRNYNID